jgi:hypothetical protein
MKRRKFLILAGTGVVTLGVPFADCKAKVEIPSALSHPQNLSSLCDSATIRDIGKEWMTKSEEGSDAKKILNKLMGEGSTTTALKTPEEWQGWVDGKIKSDFETGKTAVIKGWVISETEARQCALYALQSK